MSRNTGRTLTVLAGMALAVTSVSAHNAGGSLTQGPPNSDQTIIMIRHGEKPSSHPSGQLNCQGLNRALALPAVLAKYGRPVAIFAPNPAEGNAEGNLRLC